MRLVRKLGSSAVVLGTAFGSHFDVLKGASVASPQHSGEGVDGCQRCPGQPGLCVAACEGLTELQPDCTCACPADSFEVWHIKGLYLEGDGIVMKVTVYNSSNEIVADIDGELSLPLHLDVGGSQGVGLVVVQGSIHGRSASLSVVDRHGERLHVEEYQNFPLYADRPSYLFHRRVSQDHDTSLSCAPCADSSGSTLPRQDVLSCSCRSGYSRSLLGECTETLTGLPAPRFSIEAGVHTAGTLLELSVDASSEASWLTEIRYEAADAVTRPTCSSTQYTDPLDLIHREVSVTVCALTCHMLHLPSPATCHTFVGSGKLAAPRCKLEGSLAAPGVFDGSVTLHFQLHPETDQTVFYTLTHEHDVIDGEYDAALPPVVSTAGDTVVHAWATKDVVGSSAKTECVVRVAPVPRRAAADYSLNLEFVINGTLGGFCAENNAYWTRRDTGFDNDVTVSLRVSGALVEWGDDLSVQCAEMHKCVIWGAP